MSVDAEVVIASVERAVAELVSLPRNERMDPWLRERAAQAADVLRYVRFPGIDEPICLGDVLKRGEARS